MSRKGVAIILVALAALHALSTGASGEAVVNENEYRDWIGRCETETTTGEVVCFIYTGRVADIEGDTFATRLVVGIGDQLDPIVYLDVPDTAEPATGFMLRIDSREPFTGRFVTCNTGWCHTQAAGEIAEQLIAQFRAGSEATVSFLIEEKDLQVDLPLSLIGFSAAFDQLLLIHQRAAAATESAAGENDGDDADGADPGDGGAPEPGDDDVDGPDAGNVEQSEDGAAPTGNDENGDDAADDAAPDDQQ